MGPIPNWYDKIKVHDSLRTELDFNEAVMRNNVPFRRAGASGTYMGCGGDAKSLVYFVVHGLLSDGTGMGAAYYPDEVDVIPGAAHYEPSLPAPVPSRDELLKQIETLTAKLADTEDALRKAVDQYCAEQDTNAKLRQRILELIVDDED